MKYLLAISFILFSITPKAHPVVCKPATALFHYFLQEVAIDDLLTYEQREAKVAEFATLAQSLSPTEADLLTHLLLQETRLRVQDILSSACLDPTEVAFYLADNEEAILNTRNMDVETARQMLFFVAELKIHRELVYQFGISLGCPKRQLVRHDLCKLERAQFEAYARYFRGGRKACDRAAFLAAWQIHQREEHHVESYTEANIGTFSQERLKNNMLETVADMLASTKQRGGGTLTDWLIHIFPTKKPHPHLIPFLEQGLKKANDIYETAYFYIADKELFFTFPCWNSQVEQTFQSLRT